MNLKSTSELCLFKVVSKFQISSKQHLDLGKGVREFRMKVTQRTHCCRTKKIEPNKTTQSIRQTIEQTNQEYEGEPTEISGKRGGGRGGDRIRRGGRRASHARLAAVAAASPPACPAAVVAAPVPPQSIGNGEDSSSQSARSSTLGSAEDVEVAEHTGGQVGAG